MPDTDELMRRRDLSAKINQNCAPLFIGNYFLSDGHSSQTPNATATFVRFEGVTYVVTCSHVKALATAADGVTARLHGHHTLIALSNWSNAGLVPSLQDVDDDRVDISICPLPDLHMEVISKAKQKTPIDLDNYVEPIWGNVNHCVAAGFPDRAKTNNDTVVESPMIEIIAEVASNLGPNSPTFVLQSKLEAPPALGFSGISGGPIFALDGDQVLPVGIVFEGLPSGEETVPSPASFFGDCDIMVRGHLLTPATFSDWLKRAR